MALLEVRGLRKSFGPADHEVPALADVTIDIAEGEFVSILGPSGCGKTTFLHILGGFVGASAGQALLRNRAIGAPGPDRGMMFQDFSLFPWLTAKQNICWPMARKGMKKTEQQARAQAILDMVHLSRFGDAYPAQLSGGMRQRVALARLIALDPEILLLDEPFGALDPQTRELLQEELQAIWRQNRKTAVLVTHDIDEAIYLGTRVVLFSARPGRIKADMPVPAGVDRPPDFRKSPLFLELRNTIWDLLREEVIKTASTEVQ
jgi:NitT/TauT family transport system ATP-binding protein